MSLTYCDSRKRKKWLNCDRRTVGNEIRDEVRETMGVRKS
jgi:hypothetical protein